MSIWLEKNQTKADKYKRNGRANGAPGNIQGRESDTGRREPDYFAGFSGCWQPHYHACGGKGQCTTCCVLLLEGQEQLPSPTSHERAIKNVKKFPDNVRLASQSRVQGERVPLQRLIRDETGRFIFVDDTADNVRSMMGRAASWRAFLLISVEFTPFVESSLSFDVIHIMRRIFALFEQVIAQYNGKIIDTAGDGLNAIFGLNTKIKQAAESAVLAGLKILADLEDLLQHLHAA